VEKRPKNSSKRYQLCQPRGGCISHSATSAHRVEAKGQSTNQRHKLRAQSTRSRHSRHQVKAQGQDTRSRHKVKAPGQGTSSEHKFKAQAQSTKHKVKAQSQGTSSGHKVNEQDQDQGTRLRHKVDAQDTKRTRHLVIAPSQVDLRSSRRRRVYYAERRKLRRSTNHLTYHFLSCHQGLVTYMLYVWSSFQHETQVASVSNILLIITPPPSEDQVPTALVCARVPQSASTPQALPATHPFLSGKMEATASLLQASFVPAEREAQTFDCA